MPPSASLFVPTTSNMPMLWFLVIPLGLRPNPMLEGDMVGILVFLLFPKGVGWVEAELP
jgi:hypothetical protein